MSTNRKKILILLLSLVSFIVLILIFLFLLNPFESESQKLAKEIRKITSENSAYLPSEQIEKDLKIISDNRIPDIKKYESIKNVFLYFDNAYINSNNPELRLFIKRLDEYSAQNLKIVYEKSDFYTACVDSMCGEETPTEIENIIKEVERLPIDEEWRNSITFNLKTASHIPYDNNFNKNDKLITYSLAIGQLSSLEIAEASASANRLRAFIKKKYNQDL